MHALDIYQKHLMKILESRPVNLSNEVRQFTIQFFTKVPTPPILLRQRTFVMILMVNELTNVPGYRSYVNKILEEIFQCVDTFLDTQEDDYKNALTSTGFTSMSLVDDTIPIILKLKLRKLMSTVKALYKIPNETCEMAIKFKRILKGLIEDSPRLVVDWIDNLQFNEFKKEYFDELIVSIMIERLDLKDLLIKNENDARKVVEFLDKALDRRNHKNELFNEIRRSFTDTEIVKKITKFAKFYSINALVHCPNSVRKRRLCDYLFNLYTRSPQERVHLTLHVMPDLNNASDNFDIVRALATWEKSEQYAGIAFGRLYELEEKDLRRINPDYENIIKCYEEKIDAKMSELARQLISEEYTDKLDIAENYIVHLIDNLEKLEFAMEKLREKNKLAFDVEANYVCQTVASVQEAVLLQIAFDDCGLLIDIFVLKQQIADEHIKKFFELFFGDKIERIGFNIKADVDYLKRTFEWMPEYIETVQPEFRCVQRIADFIQSNEKYESLFEVLETVSLKEIASKWLGVDMSKDQQQGNWLKRPLSKDQMHYAATDALHTLNAYTYVQSKIHEKDLTADLDKCKVTPKMIADRKKTKAKAGYKETLEDILPNVEKEIKEMRETLYNFEIPQNITIVVDFAFLLITPYLRRFGFKTYDQRDVPDGEHLSRDEVITELSKFLQTRIKNGTISHCFLLTDVNSNLRFTTKVDIDEFQIINCGLDESESSIICAIMKHTKTVFDLTDIPNCCTKCGQSKSAVDFPSDVFRIVYIHYAKHKKYFAKLKCEDHSHEILERLVQENIVQLKDEILIYYINDKCFVNFNLGNEIMGQINYQNENGITFENKKKYKCNTQLFETLGDKSNIRFCLPCFEFF